MTQIEHVIPRNELIDTVHGVTLANNPTVRPYENASISIKPMSVDEFSPTTLYVLRGGLQFQQKLR